MLGGVIIRDAHYLSDASPIGLFLAGAGIVVSPIAGIGAILASIDGRKIQKRSLVSFNEAHALSSRQEKQIEISLVVRSGLGIQFKF